MHKVFISFYHKDDQWYKDTLVKWAKDNHVFIDGSVDTGDIDENLNDEEIRQIIRDEYLRDTSVTVVLVGPNTKHRKHVDWEIYSSMYDGKLNKKSGLLVIMLPETNCYECHIPFDDEKLLMYPNVSNWISVDSRSEFERRYPAMPDRIIDNLMTVGVKISVVPWSKITVASMRLLLDNAYNERTRQQYYLKPMRRHNGYCF